MLSGFDTTQHEQKMITKATRERRLTTRGLLIGNALFVLSLVATPVFAAPTITANPNPVNVAFGQTQGKTTINWNTEGAGGFIWMSVDGGDETQVAADVAKGSVEISVVLGKSYELRLYSAGKERILASVKVTVQVTPSSVGGVLENAKNAITDDFDLKRTDQGRILGQTPRELRCRGGANLEVKENGDYFIYFTFGRATLAVDPAGRNLNPGQCGWTDRPMRDDERNALFQATDKTKGDVWQSRAAIPNGERFPKYDELKSTLRNPNRYWSFFVRDIKRTEMFSEYSRQWLPIKPSSIQKIPRVSRP